MRVSSFAVVALLAASLTLGPRLAWGQPDLNAAPVVPNPPNQTPEARQQQAIEQAQALAKMTPEQQKAAIQKMLEQSLRMQLTNIGMTDEQDQTAVLECIASQEKERDKVRAQAAKVFNLTRTNAVPANDAEVNGVLNAYLAAVDDAKVQREDATKALEERLNLSQKPKLKAYLTFIGIIGDAAWYTADMQLLGSMSLGSLALGGNITR